MVRTYLWITLVMFGLIIMPPQVFGASISKGEYLKAASKGDLETVKEYLLGGGDINIKSWLGDTAISNAAVNGRMEVVRHLVKSGADINVKQKILGSVVQPIHLATLKNRKEVVLYLLDEGANINAPGPKGRTPLIMATDRGFYELAKALIVSGADMDAVDSLGKNAFYYAKTNGNRDTELISMMKSAGISDAPSSKTNKSISRQSGTGSSIEPIKCVEKAVSGITKDQAKALRYLINKRYSDKGISVCIEEIMVSDQFKLKGNTVVKYKFIAMFPVGYKTECLGSGSTGATQKRLKKSFNWSDWGHMTQKCSPYELRLSGVKPTAPGEKHTYTGDDEI